MLYAINELEKALLRIKAMNPKNRINLLEVGKDNKGCVYKHFVKKTKRELIEAIKLLKNHQEIDSIAKKVQKTEDLHK